MAIHLSCRCGKKLAVREELAGRKGKCPSCGTVLAIPSGAPAPAPPKPPPAAKSPSAVFKPAPAHPVLSPAGKAAPGHACPSCGAPVKSQEIFCVKCGASLENRSRSARTRKSSSVSLPRVAGSGHPLRLKLIKAAAVAGPLLAGFCWHLVSESRASRDWRSATQDGTVIKKPESIDKMVNRDQRELIRIAKNRIANDIGQLSGWSFASRREGYEDLYHLVDLAEVPTSYRPDQGWWTRRREIAKIEVWWEEGREGLFWNFQKQRFGVKRKAVAESAPADGNGG